MSDPSTRSPDTYVKRAATTSDMTAAGAALGLATGFGDWFFIQCYAGGHWHYVPPSANLIEVAAPIVILPFGLWLMNVLSIIGEIITNRLKKAE